MKTIRKHLLPVLVMVLAAVPSLGGVLPGQMKFSVKVSNEQGEPISDAEVVVFTYFKGEWVERRESLREGVADFQFVGKGSVDISTKIEGYYTESILDDSYRLSNNKPGVYEPWGKVYSVVLRKKINPRPLFVKIGDWMKIPDSDGTGYDLEVGDWVAPHGKGIVSDFIFSAENRIVDGSNDYFIRLDIRFSNEHDGIFALPAEKWPEYMSFRSGLLLGHAAPTEATYMNHAFTQTGLKPITRTKFQELDAASADNATPGCFFRVRSRIEPETGKVVGRYGKMYQFFRLSRHDEESPTIRFEYYLAPDESPSLEFNGKSLVEGAEIPSEIRRH